MRQDKQLLQQKRIPWPCLFKNNFNDDFIRRNNYRLTRTTEINDTATPTLATIPYIKSMYDNISRILQPFNISTSSTNPSLHYVSYQQTSKTRTNRRTDREQFMRSTTPTAKLPSSERLAETDSKEFVFEETTWTSSLLISSASRFILELPAETSTEFSNKWRWTGGERLYSIRSGEDILTYTDTKNVRYLYVNIQWQSLLNKND